MRFTVVDLFRRKPARTDCLRFPLGETIPERTSPPTGIHLPVHIRARGCACDRSYWYTCPKEKVNLKKGYHPPYETVWLYYKCANCGIRWNPWSPGNPKFLLACKAIGQENALDLVGERFDERTRIDPTALGWGDNDW